MRIPKPGDVGAAAEKSAQTGPSKAAGDRIGLITSRADEHCIQNCSKLLND
jgi:hypothetical protein